MAYPTKITEILAQLRPAKPISGNALGSDANFACGSFVRYWLTIDRERKLVTDAGFSSNGCGYMLAASETLALRVVGKKLSELHSLEAELTELTDLVDGEKRRRGCVSAAANSLRNVFADFRSRQIDEFRGEKALICTCFGVTEETIEDAIREKSLRTLDQVLLTTNAGSGCGSCRMLIEEILDAERRHSPGTQVQPENVRL